jgi:hypothetical protein
VNRRLLCLPLALWSGCSCTPEDPEEAALQARIDAAWAQMVPTGEPSNLAKDAATAGARSALPDGTPGLVVLAVLDTVRADHTSLCGYGRDNTQILKKLVERGASWTCDAYAPGTWTLPSHATFFSGLPVTSHDLHRKGLALADDVETLAETFRARGYQTLMVSANPTLKEPTGLQQGFSYALVPRGLVSPLRGVDGLPNAVRWALRGADRTKPLFLVVNLFDAHDPYPPIVTDALGLGIAPRPTFNLHLSVDDAHDPWKRLGEGTLTPSEAQAWLGHATDTYDYGIAWADRALGRVLGFLEDRGWTDHGVRVVVTSDHGEALGEHGKMQHGHEPWQELARVPLLVLEEGTGRKPPALPSPISGAVVHRLVLDGQLPSPLPAVESHSFRYGESDTRFAEAAATWDDAFTKHFWREGEASSFDLRTDPREASPRPDEVSTLTDAVQRHQASRTRAGNQTIDEAVAEGLGALGYVE